MFEALISEDTLIYIDDIILPLFVPGKSGLEAVDDGLLVLYGCRELVTSSFSGELLCNSSAMINSSQSFLVELFSKELLVL